MIYSKEPVNAPQPRDDIDLRNPTRPTITLARRYSELAQTSAMATELNTEGIRHLDSFELFLTARELMAIEIDYAALAGPVPAERLPVPPPPDHAQKKHEAEPEGPEIQCIACCTQLPKEREPLYAREVIKPCRSCNSAYCVSCVKGMFLSACKDSTRMPPRCCMQIHLHHIKPHLSHEEISEYKARYEEWSTPKPLYCPIPICSTFIPERLLPRRAGARGKRKVDSGIGTPTSPNIKCTECDCEICVDCRQMSHPGNVCANMDLGVDVDTAALLKAWGYKRCPKCSQGIKRMYGCNHMGCRCGAHFCWGCMKSRDECEGDCYEDEDRDEPSDSEPDEPEPLPESNDGTVTVKESADNDMAVSAQRTTRTSPTVTATPSQVTHRPRNLDGGGAHYWEEQDFDFGDEPTDDVQDRVWECHHDFEPYTISLPDAISRHPSMLEMECVKCWRMILPGIETPAEPSMIPTSPYSKRSVTGRSRGRGRGARGRGCRHGTIARSRPEAYVAPRGLMRSDATVGTAPHLTTQLLSLPRLSSRASSHTMEGVQPGIMPKKTATSGSPASNVFSDPSKTLSIAQECYNCSLLVCKHCANRILAQREAERAARTVE